MTLSTTRLLASLGITLLASHASAQTISGQQAAQYWIQAGGNSGNCADAVAVAMAESGLNTQARNVNSDSHHSIDRGLWQINNYWHPEISDSCAYSAACNAKGAFSISSGGSNWTPWSTWNNGAARQHYAAAQQACSGGPGPSPPGPSPGPSPGGGCNACVKGGGGEACIPKCGACGSACTQCIQYGGGMACASKCCGSLSSTMKVEAPQAALCFHVEDKKDHKCFEACNEEGKKFHTKGIDLAGGCPAEYNTVDSIKSVRQCPDGVTNVKYCKATAVKINIKTKGEKRQDDIPVVPLSDTVTSLPPKNLFDKDVPNSCSKPGDCGRAYQACCAGFAAKGFPCKCHLEDGSGKSGDCGTCGTGFSACCAGFKAKGFPCSCDIQ